jgi:hypothetical protein
MMRQTTAGLRGQSAEPDVCSLVGSYRHAAKGFTVNREELPQVENNIYTQMFYEYKAHQKLIAKFYQYVYDKWTMQASRQRMIVLEKQCYTFEERTTSSWGTLLRSYPFVDVFVSSIFPDFEPKSLANSKEKFLPSKNLVHLVKTSMTIPDDQDVKSLLNDMGLSAVSDEVREQNITEMITTQFEGMLTSIAKRAVRAGAKPRINDGGSFVDEVGKELMFRLGLKIFAAPRVLDQLHKEVIHFLRVGSRSRKWGNISLKDGEIIFEIHEGAFARPNYTNLNP